MIKPTLKAIAVTIVLLAAGANLNARIDSTRSADAAPQRTAHEYMSEEDSRDVPGSFHAPGYDLVGNPNPEDEGWGERNYLGYPMCVYYGNTPEECA